MVAAKQSQKGFTLVEIMVAMFLILLAMTYTTPFISLQMRRVRALRMEQEASYCSRRVIEFFQSLRPEDVCSAEAVSGNHPKGDRWHMLGPGGNSFDQDLVNYLNEGIASPDMDPCVANALLDPPDFHWRLEGEVNNRPTLYCFHAPTPPNPPNVCEGRLHFKVVVRFTLPEAARLGGITQEVAYETYMRIFDKKTVNAIATGGGSCSVSAGSDCSSCGI